MSSRVATNTAYRNSVYYMQRRNVEVEKASEQYNTGKKFQTAADSPANFAATMRLENDIAMYEQYTTNSGYAYDSLSLEETALGTINTVLDRANVLMQSGVNGRNSGSDLTAISQELKEIQKQLKDLINTKTATGESIFSGSLSDQDAYVFENGKYVCKADNGQRSVQASASAQIAVSDSSKDFFEMVATARTAESDSLSISYADYQTFESFYNKNYRHNEDPATEEVMNKYTVEKTGVNSYTITDAEGTTTYSDVGKTINFNGLSIDVSNMVLGASETFSLAKPANKNILNTLGDAIKAIDDYNNGTIDINEVNNILAQTQISAKNTQVSVNGVMTKIGARQNTLDNIINANTDISAVKQEAKATISEVDLYEASTNVTKTQTYLQMAMTSFKYVTGTTLFDYIR